ncbi:MAG: two-component regulator propeller domain-containing protein [Candidatus Aminicenantales bacterium]
MNIGPCIRRIILWLKAIVLLGGMIWTPGVSLGAQDLSVKFNHITINEGLSQSYIYCILQDRRGFMWFGTEDGLNKYDGYGFKIYKHDPKSPDSLSYNYVRAIHEDQSGFIWVGTYSGGLDKFDPKTERFIHCRADPDNPDSLSSNYVNSLYEDHNGFLWIGTNDGLNRLDPKTGRLIRYQSVPNDPYSLSHNKVNTICEDREGFLWVGTEEGLNRLDLKRERFRRYYNEPNNPNSLSKNSISCIREDRMGHLWIGTFGGGLDRLDREKGRFIHHCHNPNDLYSLSNDFVRFIYEDHEGDLWIGTFGGGINKFVRESSQFIYYQHDPSDPHSLGSNVILSIYEDQSRMLWIGTYIGLSTLDREKKKFVLYRAKPNDPNSLSHDHIYSICEDRSGILWVGTYGGGLNRIDRTKNIFTRYHINPGASNSLSSNLIRSIQEDHLGGFWVGTYGGGLNRLDRRTGKFTRYRYDPEDSSSLSSDLVRVVREDSRGNLWIGTEDGLNKFVRETHSFIRYKHDSRNPFSLSSNYIYTIQEDRQGMLWIGALDGLNRFDSDKEECIRFKHVPGDPGSLSSSEVLSLYENQSGVLWIGTSVGLNKFDRAQRRFTCYTEKDGLSNNTVLNIVEDDQGNLWLGTNKGISKFNPRTLDFKNYYVEDGLQSNEFNLGACFKTRSGEIFMGGVYGLNSFYPERIRQNPYVPYVVITDFQIFNSSVPIGRAENGRFILKKSITETEEIKLSHKDRVLTFEFAALHYASPENNQYAYIMEGFENDWNYVGNRRFVTYTNLPPGEYTFRVKGSNSDGLWNEKGTSVIIKIAPAFWNTWWFRGLAVLSVLLMIVVIIQIRTQTIRQRSRQLEQRIEERTMELKAANEELQQEIGERKHAEEALHARQAYLDRLFESAQEAIVMLDTSHRISRVNDEFTKLFGYSREEAMGRTLDDLVARGDLAEDGRYYTRRLGEGKRLAFESVRHRKDGTLINVSVIGAPIIVGKENVGFYAIYRDITGLIKAEEDAKRRAAQAALLYKVGQRVSSKLDSQALLSEIVTTIRDAFNYYGVMLLLLDERRESLILQAIAGGYEDVFPKNLTHAVGEGMIGYAAETGKIQVSGDVSQNPHFVQISVEKTKSELSVPVKSGERVIGVLDIQSDEYNAFNETDVAAMETLSTQIATAIENAELYREAQREITERKQAENMLKTLLKEKEVLLKEIHHRVKNNMQIVSSLLNLQASHVKSEKIRDMFKKSRNRIFTMALIHEKLYQSKDLAWIDFGQYIRGLIVHLSNSYRIDAHSVHLRGEVDEVFLDVNEAIPCGLIVNELVSNALKYAFPEGRRRIKRAGRKNEICIRMDKDENGQVTLSVRDNGVGLPEDLDIRKTESLGLQLVSDLVTQLDGSIELERSRGTEFKITFRSVK